MIEPEREELLSAYLDGEVSPEERARVEQWLAESDELRQLRDELLALRTDLQGLPRHEVGHDLAAAVMHRSAATPVAEESKRSAPAVDPPANDQPSLGNVVAEWWNRGSQGRRFLWPVLAVAAALAILVFDARQRPTEFEVAQAPEEAPASAELRDEAKEAADSSAEQSYPASVPEMSAVEAGSQPQDSPAVNGAAPPPSASPPAASPPAATPSPAAERSGVEFFESRGNPAGARRQVTPLNVPADGIQRGGTMSNKRAEKAEELDVETIVCPVSARYLEGGAFEKLLDANQVRWRQVPVPPELAAQSAPASPRTAPLESLGRTPLKSLYFLEAGSEKVNQILSQVPQSDRLMEGNRAARPQQVKATQAAAAGGVQVLLVAPTDATLPAAPAARPTR